MRSSELKPTYRGVRSTTRPASKERMRDREGSRVRDRNTSRRDNHDHCSSSKSPFRPNSTKSRKSSKKYRGHSRSSSTSSQESHKFSHRSRLPTPSSESELRPLVLGTSALSAAPVSKNICVNDLEERKSLESIEDVFAFKSFLNKHDSEKNNRYSASEKVIIDLNKETVTVPALKAIETNMVKQDKEAIFHSNFIEDAQLKADKWIRKLSNYRQRYYRE